MSEQYLTPAEAIRLRIAIRERAQNRFFADVSAAREGPRAPLTSDPAVDAPILSTTAPQSEPPNDPPPMDTPNDPPQANVADGNASNADGAGSGSEPEDLSKLSAKQLRDRLASYGITPPANTPKADLLTQLQAVTG